MTAIFCASRAKSDFKVVHIFSIGFRRQSSGETQDVAVIQDGDKKDLESTFFNR